MVRRLEREALVEYQLAIQARLSGLDVPVVTVDEARDRFDAILSGEVPAAPPTAPMSDQARLHRILGVA